MTSSPEKKILATRYSPTGDSRSTLATGALHFCVRYGNRCCYSAMATRKKAYRRNRSVRFNSKLNRIHGSEAKDLTRPSLSDD